MYLPQCVIGKEHRTRKMNLIKTPATYDIILSRQVRNKAS